MPLPQVLSLAREVIVDMFGITMTSRTVPTPVAVDTIVPFQAAPVGGTPEPVQVPLQPENENFYAEDGQGQYINPDIVDGDLEAAARLSPPRTSQLHRALDVASPELASGDAGGIMGTPPLGPLGWNGVELLGDRQAQRRQIQRRQSSIGIYKSFAEIKDW
jgi:hypothetical protein